VTSVTDKSALQSNTWQVICPRRACHAISRLAPQIAVSEMNYYQLVLDESLPHAAMLSKPRRTKGEVVDPRVFTEGVPIADASIVQWENANAGVICDINFGSFDAIVVKSPVAEALKRLAGGDIQLIQAKVGDNADLMVLNVISAVPCFDDRRSIFTRWTRRDSRPEKIGDLMMVADLKIDPELAAKHRILRPAEWRGAVIVDETVRTAIDDLRATGAKFILA
jgi:hypothetical protein